VVVNSTGPCGPQFVSRQRVGNHRVTGAPPLLQTDRVDTTRSFEADIIEELPLGVNRNFQSLLDLAPGTTRPPSSIPNSSTPAARCKPKSTGKCATATTIRSRAPTISAHRIAADFDSTGRSHPDRQHLDQQSRAGIGPGQRRDRHVVLKSGTNRIHGGAYELLQNSASTHAASSM